MYISITNRFVGRTKVVRMLIDKGVNINDVNQDGDPILVFAAAKGKIAHKAIVKIHTDSQNDSQNFRGRGGSEFAGWLMLCI